MANYHFLSSWTAKITRLSKSPQGLVLMAFICFLEPIFLPMIPELVIAPVLFARPSEWLKVIIVAWLSTLAGAVTAYLLAGMAGKLLLGFFGASGLYIYETGLSYLHRYGFFLPILGSVTPFPLKVITWTCGLTHFSFLIFFSGIAIGRIARYSLVILLNRTHIRHKSRIIFNPRREVQSLFPKKQMSSHH